MTFDSFPSAEVTARDRVIQLRDFLATLPPKRFDMNDWMDYPGWDWTEKGEPPITTLHNCGTTACIGGWANVLFFPNKGEVAWRDVGTLLGLTYHQADSLFFKFPKCDLGPTQAVAVLDHYLATSLIDWSVVL